MVKEGERDRNIKQRREKEKTARKKLEAGKNENDRWTMRQKEEINMKRMIEREGKKKERVRKTVL